MGEPFRASVCDEGVTRRGEYQPCEKVAVAIRHDPEDGGFYPVCAYHAHADMVPLVEVLAAREGSPDGSRMVRNARVEAIRDVTTRFETAAYYEAKPHKAASDLIGFLKEMEE